MRHPYEWQESSTLRFGRVSAGSVPKDGFGGGSEGSGRLAKAEREGLFAEGRHEPGGVPQGGRDLAVLAIQLTLGYPLGQGFKGRFARDTLPETVRHLAGMHWGSQLATEPVGSVPAP
jgi:hypothetical protein